MLIILVGGNLMVKERIKASIVQQILIS